MSPARHFASHAVAPSDPVGPLAAECVASWQRLQALRSHSSPSATTPALLQVDGQTMSIADVVGVARYHVVPQLSDSSVVRSKVDAAVTCLVAKLEAGESLYGISTGFGGSADSRTGALHALQLALLQHQQAGILPVPAKLDGNIGLQHRLPDGDARQNGTGHQQGALKKKPLGLSDELASLSMPESFVRGAILVRINSLLRGHSGVRWKVIEAMQTFFFASPLGPVTPLVPLRSSISASGDLSPLSYVAGALTGHPGLRVWQNRADGARELVSSDDALKVHSIEPITYEPKEALGMVNGTAFSTSVGAQAVHDASFLALLTEFTTAMAVEALCGTDGSFIPFIHDVARPHPGQVESAATLMSLLDGSSLATHVADEKATLLGEDDGHLRQDRYSLRTAAQWIGPQIEDIRAARRALEIEMNSTTDNPLIDAESNHCAHGGNFQAMSVTNAMEKVRLALVHLGKLTFAQLTELINPSMNRGLAPNLAATDPSLNYHGKGVDIAIAAVTAELGFLGSPVSTHVQSAEMHNQAVNSLALISARKTVEAVEALSMMLSWALYLLCQAVDLRALQKRVSTQLERYVVDSVKARFGDLWGPAEAAIAAAKVYHRLAKRLAETTTMDLKERMADSCAFASYELLERCEQGAKAGASDAWDAVTAAFACRDEWAAYGERLFLSETEALLSSPCSCHAAPLLGRTRTVYEYVRKELGVPVHGMENFVRFEGEKGKMRTTIGEHVSRIYEAVRTGDLYGVLVNVLAA